MSRRRLLIRRPVAVFGAACTTFVLGALIINTFFLNSSPRCIRSCSSMIKSYERLQKNEASKKTKHPTIKSFDVNFLGSNSPIADRFVTGFSRSLGIGLFSVIDGHKGFRCSHFIQTHLLKYVTSALTTQIGGDNMSDLEICMDMNQTSTTLESYPAGITDSAHSIPLSVIEECLTVSFNSVDEFISSQALNDAKLIMQGHSMAPDMKEKILRAIEGACVTLAVVQSDSVSVATTGDCRVVMGQQQKDHTWTALPLSVDQNAMNDFEVQRLKKAHPGEEDKVILNGRVLGSLMPFRTFGDVDFKWEGKYLNPFVPVWPDYRTPPYITAEPVVTHHKITGRDGFMVIASDGLWERLSNDNVVNIVVQTIEQEKPGHKSSFSPFDLFFNYGTDTCCKPNAATQLLWHALGGTEEEVTRLLDVPPSYSRMVRDDITIIVVFFNK